MLANQAKKPNKAKNNQKRILECAQRLADQYLSKEKKGTENYQGGRAEESGFPPPDPVSSQL